MFAISLEELEARTHLNNITKSNSVMIGDERRTGGSEDKGLGLLSTLSKLNRKILTVHTILCLLAPTGALGVVIWDLRVSVCLNVCT